MKVRADQSGNTEQACGACSAHAAQISSLHGVRCMQCTCSADFKLTWRAVHAVHMQRRFQAYMACGACSAHPLVHSLWQHSRQVSQRARGSPPLSSPSEQQAPGAAAGGRLRGGQQLFQRLGHLRDRIAID